MAALASTTYSPSLSAARRDRTLHRYGLAPSGAGWTLTRGDRSIGWFPTYDQAVAVAERITHDIARGGVAVSLVRPERPGAAA